MTCALTRLGRTRLSSLPSVVHTGSFRSRRSLGRFEVKAESVLEARIHLCEEVELEAKAKIALWAANLDGIAQSVNEVA